MTNIHMAITVLDDNNLFSDKRLLSMMVDLNFRNKTENIIFRGEYSTRLRIAVTKQCLKGSVWEGCICDSNSCNNGSGICEQKGLDHDCHCLEGFTGISCKNRIFQCDSNPCGVYEVCNMTKHGYNCTCLDGYEGDNCTDKVNECNPNACQNSGFCVNEYSSFKCLCVLGYSGIYCEKLIQPCDLKPCFNRGICMSPDMTYECFCAQGFFGSRCEKAIKEILPTAIQPTVTSNFYTEAYLYNLDTTHANTMLVSYARIFPSWNNHPQLSTDLEMIYMNTHTPLISANHVSVVESAVMSNMYSVSMQASIFPFSSTSSHVHLSICMNGGTQTDNNCICANGFGGGRCEIDIDDCRSDPCKEHGTCIDKINSFTCVCPNGLTGETCHIPIDECLNGGTETRHAHGYVCRCAPGFEGFKCETKLNHCSSLPCKNGATCQSVTNGYNCKCSNGFDGPHCEIPIDSCSSGPCHNSGTCVQHTHGYNCKCQSGYEGQHCDRFVNYCDPNPCSNGSTCKMRHHGYHCHCATGFYGSQCDVKA